VCGGTKGTGPKIWNSEIGILETQKRWLYLAWTCMCSPCNRHDSTGSQITFFSQLTLRFRLGTAQTLPTLNVISKVYNYIFGGNQEHLKPNQQDPGKPAHPYVLYSLFSDMIQKHRLTMMATRSLAQSHSGTGILCGFFKIYPLCSLHLYSLLSLH
jgi:hypothetical protein